MAASRREAISAFEITHKSIRANEWVILHPFVEINRRQSPLQLINFHRICFPCHVLEVNVGQYESWTHIVIPDIRGDRKLFSIRKNPPISVVVIPWLPFVSFDQIPPSFNCAIRDAPLNMFCRRTCKTTDFTPRRRRISMSEMTRQVLKKSKKQNGSPAKS